MELKKRWWKWILWKLVFLSMIDGEIDNENLH